MIRPVNILSMTFKQNYVNSNGSSVRVNNEAIRQAKVQLKIRKTVEDAIKKSDDASVKYGDVYFTMFSDGTCKLSQNDALPMYHGVVKGVNADRKGWLASELEANYLIQSCMYSSDELGSVRAYGDGYKFATIYPNGNIHMHQVASEIFPEPNED